MIKFQDATIQIINDSLRKAYKIVQTNLKYCLRLHHRFAEGDSRNAE
jgi:hypothetical protein